ncbi:Asp-tRNA(Asn)/Glu-tRNA(Gln) amidotransferase subunit GatC [Geminicoccus flavidas]|uniref:Asp-tRNA(Asn)/Glu-tRNA(Gln) amidotransferase subunit GatC n=1 Tax=Geminicoccus flavidas TaxID=2506407 RepID=UPI001359DECB|nr:Asp-tRNA(Asn)/Glu-tRNA(Gln) amidotransferase subunit GatC [Geminicoccus flavidas]
MAIDKATVAKIAHLARLEVPEEQQEHLAKELSGILGWVEQLGEVNTDAVEPLRSVMPITQDWRADEVTDGNRREDVLANAPAQQDGYFVVPKVVE